MPIVKKCLLKILGIRVATLVTILLLSGSFNLSIILEFLLRRFGNPFIHCHVLFILFKFSLKKSYCLKRNTKVDLFQVSQNDGFILVLKIETIPCIW